MCIYSCVIKKETFSHLCRDGKMRRLDKAAVWPFTLSANTTSKTAALGIEQRSHI